MGFCSKGEIFVEVMLQRCHLSGFFLMNKAMKFHMADAILLVCMMKADVFRVVHVCLHLHASLSDKKIGDFLVLVKDFTSLWGFMKESCKVSQM